MTSHLERRELGIINVADSGHVLVDGEKFELGHLDGLYVGRGSEVVFAGADAAFYFVSAPATATYPTTALSHSAVEPVPVGTAQGASERHLYRYAWGADLQTSGLQFGVTVIADGSVWNTLPPHLHDRRTEVYLYVDLPEGDRVFHFLGRARGHPAPGRGATGRPSSRRRGPSTPAPARAPTPSSGRWRARTTTTPISRLLPWRTCEHPECDRASLAVRPARQVRGRDRGRSRPRPGRGARTGAGRRRPRPRRAGPTARRPPRRWPATSDATWRWSTSTSATWRPSSGSARR